MKYRLSSILYLLFVGSFIYFARGQAIESIYKTMPGNHPGMDGGFFTINATGGEETNTGGDDTTLSEGIHADFSGTPTSGVPPLLISFTNLSTGDFDTCAWDFGDGATSSDCIDPEHTYVTCSNYTVSLTVSGPGGEDIETKVDYLSCPPYVEVNFSGTPTEGIALLEVHFTNLSNGDYDTCSWDFGDGATSSDCNDPEHTYNTEGIYTVSLAVSGPGGEDTETKTDYIKIYISTHPDFSGTPTECIAPLEVHFTNLSNGDYDTCSWDFGDGGTFTSCDDPIHTYNNPGLYTVSLTVTGPSGSETATKVNYIRAYDAVQADFSGTPTSGVPPLLISFTNLSTGDFDTCSWDFGDGSTSSDCNDPEHTYVTCSNYTVSLTVSGPGGEDTETKVDYLSCPPYVEADFSASPTEGISPLEVNFTNLSTGDFDTCSWDFGDGGSSISCGNPSHTYGSPGVYTVALTIGGPSGTETLTRVDYIHVLSGYRYYIPLAIKEH